MIALEDLKAARKDVVHKRSGSADAVYNEGLKILEAYKLNPSITRLDQAGKKFVEALGYNSEHLPSIIYVSFILYALGNEEMAFKYIKMSEILTPVLPDEINRYKAAVEKKISAKAKIK